ncbi:MAG TPA: hypothetical protein VGQ68_00880 [Gaiellaceae bacterium]|nr:hypothetical protein [Gaiellaceae bacterium]
MTRVSLALVLLVGGSLAAVAPAAQARRIASHCSPSGDVCYGIWFGSGTSRLAARGLTS